MDRGHGDVYPEHFVGLILYEANSLWTYEALTSGNTFGKETGHKRMLTCTK